MTKEFDYEEEFHGRDRKQWRKERKYAQESDRSKYKKTDQGKNELVIEIDPSWGKGRIVAITGEGIWVEAEGERFIASLKGLLKKTRKEAKNILAVGDVVRFTADRAIAAIEARYSFLARTDIRGTKEQLIAVNVDQAVIVVSVVNPPLKPALVDRYLIAASRGNIQPIIVVNKLDLLDGAPAEEKIRYHEFLTVYKKFAVPILVVSTVTKEGIEAFRSLLRDKTSVFTGQSGVGKSSLLNASYGLNLKIGELAQKTSKGSHTTTTAELLSLPGGGYCIDTPGTRSFGIWELKRDDVMAHFSEFSSFSCHYPDCQHVSEPECQVLRALGEGHISLLRYESYRTLLDEVAGKPDNRTKRKENHESD